MTQTIYVTVSDFSSDAKKTLMDFGLDVTVREQADRPSEDELCELVSLYDILIIGASENMTPRVYERNTRTSYVGTLSIAIDHISSEYLESQSIVIQNCPQSNVASVAEHTYGFMLSLYKRLPEAHQASINGLGRKGLGGPTYDLMGKTLGVLGAGRIGRRVLEIGGALRLDLLCYTFHPENHEDLRNLGVVFTELDDLVRRSDIVTIHLPLTRESQNIMDASKISAMKRNSLLVNTSRPEVLDADAAVSAVADGRIGGLGIDGELDKAICERLRGMTKVIVSPHTAGVSTDAIARMDTDIADSIIDYCKSCANQN